MTGHIYHTHEPDAPRPQAGVTRMGLSPNPTGTYCGRCGLMTDDGTTRLPHCPECGPREPLPPITSTRKPARDYICWKCGTTMSRATAQHECGCPKCGGEVEPFSDSQQRDDGDYHRWPKNPNKI